MKEQDTDSDEDHLGYREAGRDALHKGGHEPVYLISAGASQPDTHYFKRNRGLTRFLCFVQAIDQAQRCNDALDITKSQAG